MMKINWAKDDRKDKIEYYLLDPNKKHPKRIKNRIIMFIDAWGTPETKGISNIDWSSLGRLYGSVLGNVDRAVKIGIYRVLLDQYLASGKVVGATKEKQELAQRVLDDY